MRDELAADLLAELTQRDAARVLEEMASDQAADVLAETDAATTERLLGSVSPDFAADVRNLLDHHPESARGLMITDIAALPVGLTVGEAVERIRQLHEEFDDLSYVLCGRRHATVTPDTDRAYS